MIAYFDFCFVEKGLELCPVFFCGGWFIEPFITAEVVATWVCFADEDFIRFQFITCLCKVFACVDVVVEVLDGC